MKLLPLIIIFGCVVNHTPKATVTFPSGIAIYFVDGVSLDVHRINVTVANTFASALAIDDRYDPNKMPLERLGIYVRGGKAFYCFGQFDAGCEEPQGGGIAIAAENPDQCPYALIAHELGHWIKDNIDHDPDPDHKDAAFFGPSADSVDHMAGKAAAQLCDYQEGHWL